MAAALSTTRPGERRQPRMRIVAAPPRELVDHPVGPVLCAGFPAVADQEAQPARTHQWSDGALVVVQVRIHVGLHVLGVQLVHLEPRALRRRGVVRDAQQRIAHAEHDPLAGRRRPVERAVGLHLRCEVENVALPQRVGRRDLRRRQIREPGERRERRLLFESRHARAGVQHELRDLILGRWRRKRKVDVECEVAAAASRTPP